MNFKKCDRCGGSFQSGIVTGLVLKKCSFLGCITKEVDLCKECRKDLKEWFNQIRLDGDEAEKALKKKEEE